MALRPGRRAGASRPVGTLIVQGRPAAGGVRGSVWGTGGYEAPAESIPSAGRRWSRAAWWRADLQPYQPPEGEAIRNPTFSEPAVTAPAIPRRARMIGLGRPHGDEASPSGR